MNRYDTASVAKFNPLTLNEILLAPTVMREKHDKGITAMEAMRLKPDPYSKHYNRALELKQQMDSEISKNVDELNSKGYNPVTFQNIVKLNRQYQDLTSPTGEVGQINAENVNIKKINEDYDKLGKEKGWGQDRIDYWKNKALQEYNEKPLYDANGRILTYSGPEGIVNKIDVNKRLHDLASSAKMSTTEFANAVTQLGIDEKSGYNVANKSAYSQKLGDNYNAVKAAYDTLKKEMKDPTSEVYQSMRYEGRDPESLLDILHTQSDVYKQNMKSIESSNDINPFGPGPDSNSGNNPQYSVVGEDYNTSEVGGFKQEMSELDRIGVKEGGKLMTIAGSGITGSQSGKDYKGKVFSIEDVKDPKQKALYENMFKKLSTTGVQSKDGKYYKLTPDFIKKGMNDPKVAQTVLKYLKEAPPITLTSKLLTANQLVNSQGFVAGLGTTADDVDKNIRRQLERGNNKEDQSGRKLIDPETNKPMTWNEAVKEYDINDINDVKYHGQISAHNWEENESLGSNSKFSPHVVTIKIGKNKYKTFKTTRLNSDNIGGNPARMNDLTTNYREATLNRGDWIDFKSDSPKLKNIRIKYNPNESEVDQYTGEPLSWEIDFKNGQPPQKTTEGKYMNWVNSL